MIRITLIQDAIAIDVVVTGIDLSVRISVYLATVIFSITITVRPQGLVDVTFIRDAIDVDIGAPVLGTRVEPDRIGFTIIANDGIRVAVSVNVAHSDSISVKVA